MPAVSDTIRRIIERGLFERLPMTFATYTFDRIRDWGMLFPAEQSYFERLLGLLDRSEPALVSRLFTPLSELEQRMGLDPGKWNTRQFTLGHVDFLQRSPHYAEWRRRIAGIFEKIDPLLEQEIAHRGRPRLVIVTAPSEVPVAPAQMWKRIEKAGKRIGLEAPAEPELLSGLGAGLLERYSAWLIEAGAVFPPLGQNAIRLSYEVLEPYRTALMDAVRKMLDAKQIRGPQQLGAELKSLKTPPPAGPVGQDPLIADFLRSVLLAGNGTLLINNTFVEWATIQAVRRARPTVAVVSFGVRNKVKPFSSLLIYTDQETSSPIPTQTDTLGTYVDLEVFYQYIWQEFEKYAEYRSNTVYVFAGIGMDEMLVIAPPDFSLMAGNNRQTLPRVGAALKEWIGA